MRDLPQLALLRLQAVQRLEHFGQCRGLFHARAPDDQAPQVGHHAPVIVRFRRHHGARADQAGERDHHAHRAKVLRALHAFSAIGHPLTQGFGQQLRRKGRHRRQRRRQRRGLRPLLLACILSVLPRQRLGRPRHSVRSLHNSHQAGFDGSQPELAVQVIEVGVFRAARLGKNRQRQRPMDRLCRLQGLGMPDVAGTLPVIVPGQDQLALGVLLAHLLCDRQQVPGRESHQHGPPCGLMQSGASGKAFAHDHMGRGQTAQQEVAAIDASPAQVLLVAVGIDELQAVQQSSAIAHWHQQLVAFDTGAMGLDPLALQVGVVLQRLRRAPARQRHRPGFLLALQLVGFAFELQRLQALAVGVALPLGHGAVGLSAPFVRDPLTPASESPGRDAVGVQHIPARIIAGPVVGGKAVEQSIGLDQGRWQQTCGHDGLFEFFDHIHDGCFQTMVVTGRGALSAAPAGTVLQDIVTSVVRRYRRHASQCLAERVSAQGQAELGLARPAPPNPPVNPHGPGACRAPHATAAALGAAHSRPATPEQTAANPRGASARSGAPVRPAWA